MASVISPPVPADQQDDMEIADTMQDDADLDIDFDEPAENFDQAMNEDTMEEDGFTVQEPEDIELRSATAEADDYMIDEASVTGPQEDDDIMVQDEIQPTEMDEELLDFSDDQLEAQQEMQRRDADSQEVVAQNQIFLDEAVEPSRKSSQPSQEDSLATKHEDIVKHEETFANAQHDSALNPVAHTEAGTNGTNGLGTELDREQYVIEDIKAPLDTASNDGDDYERQKHEDQPGTPGHRQDEYVIEEMKPPSGAVSNVGDDHEGHRHAHQPETPGSDQEEYLGVHGHGDNVDESTAPAVEVEDLGENTELPVVEETSFSQPNPGSSPKSNGSDGQHTKTGLHPAIVKFADGQYALFPSNEPTYGEEYFLENENLASGSIGDLLQACRGTLGEAIGPEEELELHVEDLGLYLSEESTAAFSTSFSELLDIFVQLHRQDGNEQPPPMMIALTPRIRFADRLTLLANAVAEGKGYSDLAFLHAHDEVVDHEQTDAPEGEKYQEEPEMGNSASQEQDTHSHTEGVGSDAHNHEEERLAEWHYGQNDDRGDGEAGGVDSEDVASSHTLSDNHNQPELDEQYRDEQALFDDSGQTAWKNAQEDEEEAPPNEAAETTEAEKATVSNDRASDIDKVRPTTIADSATGDADDDIGNDDDDDNNNKENEGRTATFDIKTEPAEQEEHNDFGEIDYSDYEEEPEALGDETKSFDAGPAGSLTPTRKRPLETDATSDPDMKRARPS